ncbi:hypothetical protein [Streptomyces sp. NBC_00878]|uniref:hypothetical protein n=1 Tax=Streptomyces sp. NBC_00878 TaxID=2975854 RepID=UPI00224E04DB|nr:hypothetical protein [Streptomyces sp. NBC_00878]MCX4908943.1 hypothetical protein [Streptomyces sp. NBC_00878]
MTTSGMQTGTTGSLKVKALVLGVVAVAILVVGAGGAYWWHQHNLPSQASAADCALAQKIIDEAQKQDKSTVTKWLKDVRELRYAEMKDGYLSGQIGRYEGATATHLTGEGEASTKAELADMSKQANAHCTAAKRTLVFPPIAA